VYFFAQFVVQASIAAHSANERTEVIHAFVLLKAVDKQANAQNE
jgi:hypothetical protein